MPWPLFSVFTETIHILWISWSWLHLHYTWWCDSILHTELFLRLCKNSIKECCLSLSRTCSCHVTAITATWNVVLSMPSKLFQGTSFKFSFNGVIVCLALFVFIIRNGCSSTLKAMYFLFWRQTPWIQNLTDHLDLCDLEALTNQFLHYFSYLGKRNSGNIHTICS